MRRCTLSLAAALSLFAGAAVADGLPERVSAASCCETPRSWTGFYIGAGLGAGAVVHDLSVTTGGGSASFDGIGGEGGFGTAIIGYDHQIGPRFVAGIFLDYDFSNLSTNLVAGGFGLSLDQDHAWSLGARLGLLTSPSTLWYVAAGYTESKFEVTTSTGASFSLPDFKGYFVGGGAEAQLADGFSLRAEYRFSQFGSETIFSTPGLNVDLEPSVHTARLALTYKFGRR